jgi:hypothetical protein
MPEGSGSNLPFDPRGPQINSCMAFNHITPHDLGELLLKEDYGYWATGYLSISPNYKNVQM